MKLVGIAYSKLRNEIGLVGIDVRPEKKEIHIKLVRQWDSVKVNEITPEIEKLYKKYEWNMTYIEQETGEYLIHMLEMKIPTKVITTQKKVKNAREIQKIKTMDKIEMTEYLRQLKLNDQIKFPEKSSKNMLMLESQIPFFAKHTTEAGSVDYYSPGKEPDNLVKALMIACFSARNLISTDDNNLAFGGSIDFGDTEADFDFY